MNFIYEELNMAHEIKAVSTFFTASSGMLCLYKIANYICFYRTHTETVKLIIVIFITNFNGLFYSLYKTK